ncbi:PhzF family phenazine biosynthesis protein [Chitinophaga qingshengii]|uniref:PhzF family phenazine biosynthesis protein n=1 Tax=Chitinophaga qingshengii TaxID=1569794 RepID=A0ABR7TTZ3_9BACT|nr:PhzF family phenazine biosynthesis protein [Chitinophaga qingshengii]MBC9932921.1 PhzF family phenazine biosynthesis protein [Chitinophaga qingshengii]
MQLPLYQIDAFTDHIFGGNPACVMPLTEWLPDEVMLQIARENAVAETAFFMPQGDGFALRWFTPEIEMDLCGHATLATAHAIRTLHAYSSSSLQFYSRSGLLTVDFEEDRYTLTFPARKPLPAALPTAIQESLDRMPVAVLQARDYVLVYETEADVRNIQINRQLLDRINLDPGGVVITAPGEDCDFVSRYFTPQASIFEDPVTGSAHCSLIPYWSERLQQTTLLARQLSDRGGTLYCTHEGDTVKMAGYARTYFTGICQLPA